MQPKPPPAIDYIADSAVDAQLDLALRELLSTCFTKPQDHVFRTRRHFNEPPAHRWLIRDGQGGLAAQLAAHEKRLFTEEGGVVLIGGVAEVCVRPDHQGRGYVGAMLAAAHAWMRDHGIAFSLLSGNPRYYASSGYRAVDNLLRDGVGPSGEVVRVKAEGMLAVALSKAPWPQGELYLPGPSF